MKKLNAMFLIRIFALGVLLNLVSVIFPVQISAQQNDVNFQEFYDQLSPYGQWIEDYNYGYVWIPTAGPDFTPYLTNGYWVLTDYGWMWASEYDWGWATFHYGRWDYNGSYGWFWVPDNEWGPSWVTWRRSQGYYGWTPMRPGISISISFGNYNNVPNDRWIFVRDRDIERHDIGRHYIDRKNNFNIINNSTVINKTYYDNKRHTTYIAGPGREDVQKIIGSTIKPIAVHERDKPGQSIGNDQLLIYRPVVEKNNRGHKPAPTEVTKFKDVKRVSERDAVKQPWNLQLPISKTRKAQQPVVNTPNKINRRENSPQQRNTNSPNNNIIQGQRPAVNPVNKIDTKSNVYQAPRLDPPKKENKIVQPLKPKTIEPKNNNSTDRPQKVRTINPPKKNSVDPPSKPKSKDYKK
ncbi:MAG: DUF6600 domain-containing protein [Melioribacteraceae bacterium]